MPEFPQTDQLNTLAIFVAWDFARSTTPGNTEPEVLLKKFETVYTTVRRIIGADPSPKKAETMPR